MMVYTLDRLIKIATDLTAQKDIDVLLETILSEAMQITSCDAGTVYTREGEFLYFRNMITLSKGIALSSKDGGIKLPPVPFGRSHVCACAALDHKIINIADIYLSEEYDFSGTPGRRFPSAPPRFRPAGRVRCWLLKSEPWR